MSHFNKVLNSLQNIEQISTDEFVIPIIIID